MPPPLSFLSPLCLSPSFCFNAVTSHHTAAPLTIQKKKTRMRVRLDWNWSHSSQQPMTLHKQWYFNNKAINSYSTHHSPSSYGTTLWIKHQIIDSYTSQYSLYCTLWIMHVHWCFLLIRGFAFWWGNSMLTNTHHILQIGESQTFWEHSTLSFHIIL